MAKKKVALTKEQRLARLAAKLKPFEKGMKQFVDRVRAGAVGKNSGVFAMGSALADAQEFLSKPGCKGLFRAWLRKEFKYSTRTAYNYIAAFRSFGERCSSCTIPSKAMYLLAPHPAAVTRAISIDKIGREVVDEAKARDILIDLHLVEPKATKPNPTPSKNGQAKDTVGIDFDAAEAEDLAEVELTPGEQCEAHNKAIDSFCRGLLQYFKDNVPKLPYVTDGVINSARGNLKACMETFRGSKCSICPACEGEGCKECKDNGYLPTGSAAQIGRVVR